MNDERDALERPEDRFTPDTLPSAGPAYGPDQPYDPAQPEPQNEQRPLEGEVSEHDVIAGIKKRLKEHRELEESRIDVAYDHGVVILSGTVRDEAARTQAEEAALATRGVTAVDNDLEINPRAVDNQSQERPDGE